MKIPLSSYEFPSFDREFTEPVSIPLEPSVRRVFFSCFQGAKSVG